MHAATAAVFEKNRLLTGEILRRLPNEAFERLGHHNEEGTKTLAKMVTACVDRLEHRLKFIRHKRELSGCPLRDASWYRAPAD